MEWRLRRRERSVAGRQPLHWQPCAFEQCARRTDWNSQPRASYCASFSYNAEGPVALVAGSERTFDDQ